MSSQHREVIDAPTRFELLTITCNTKDVNLLYHHIMIILIHRIGSTDLLFLPFKARKIINLVNVCPRMMYQ